MKLKKLSIAILVWICVLMLPFSTGLASNEGMAETVVFAPTGILPMGPGEWDYVGSSTFVSSSAYARSGGGDFMFCLNPGPSTYYYLYEYDPDNADEYVGYVYLKAGQCGVFRNIGKYVDGKNKKAEFYVAKNVGETAHVDFWD
ncbi:hypothetical protein [Thermoactinomyces mirandus]|uniref:Uncharacterized protein n=1 Tax=Thermoactinomyces mirandus TaxID=2756294 RepID=A0A7W2ASU3_9BACL|nr:hypothetical protein [Thermoactinomyces mirandus]MBA4602841.1 hypothetical protein [Thermoactinomyces mirandus]